MRNREKKKSSVDAVSVMSDAQKQRLSVATPKEQFKRDERVWSEYLSSKPSDGDSKVSQQRKEVVQRLFLLLQNQKLSCNSTAQGEPVDFAKLQTKDNAMPLAALMSHGGRIVVSVPPIKKGEDPEQLFNWVAGGAANLSSEKTGKAAEKKGCPIFQRFAATHSVNVTSEGNIQEIKVKSSVKNAPRFMKDYIKARHWGMNLGLKEPDQAGLENGSHGHLYMYWQAPTEDKPGALMFGCEGSAPGKKSYLGSTHDTSGAPNQFSPTGGLKFTNSQFDNYPIRPDPLNGIQLKLASHDIQQVVKLKASDFQPTQLALKAGTAYSPARPAMSSTAKTGMMFAQHRGNASAKEVLKSSSPPVSFEDTQGVAKKPTPPLDSKIAIPSVLPPLPNIPSQDTMPPLPEVPSRPKRGGP